MVEVRVISTLKEKWARLTGELQAAQVRVTKLGVLGIEETGVNLRNNIARGTFTAVFFFQCLKATGVNQLRIED